MSQRLSEPGTPAAPPHDDRIGASPAFPVLTILLALHFTVGAALQVRSLPFGLAFSELFLFVAPVLLVTRALNFRPSAFLALRPPPAATVPASLGIAGASFFLAGAVNGLNRWAVGEELARRFDPSALFDHASVPAKVGLAVAVALLAPLGEELLFRGYLLRVLAARSGRAAALVTTAALFAVIHVNPASVLALFTLGLVFGALRLLTGSIWPAVVAHALQNGISVALVLSGLGASSPDDLPVEGALLLLAFSLPVVLGLFRALAARPGRSEDDAGAAAVEGDDHQLRPRRVLRPAVASLATALLALAGFAALSLGR